VEVIGHEAVGDDAHPTEGFVVSHPGRELFPFRIAQNEPAVHDPGNAVVVGHAMVLRCFQSCLAHKRRKVISSFSGKVFLTIDLSPCLLYLAIDAPSLIEVDFLSKMAICRNTFDANPPLSDNATSPNESDQS
jgi:hypothetical protein